MAHELTNRVMALGRAQDLIRPVPGRKSKATRDFKEAIKARAEREPAFREALFKRSRGATHCCALFGKRS